MKPILLASGFARHSNRANASTMVPWSNGARKITNHICAACLQKDGTTKPHAENTTDCLYYTRTWRDSSPSIFEDHDIVLKACDCLLCCRSCVVSTECTVCDAVKHCSCNLCCVLPVIQKCTCFMCSTSKLCETSELNNNVIHPGYDVNSGRTNHSSKKC